MGLGICFKMTLQTRKPEYFCSRRWWAERRVSRAQTRELLRSSTLLANIYMSSTRQGLAEPGQAGTLQEILFGSRRSEIVKEVGWIMENDQNYDIRLQARKIHIALEGIEHVEYK